MSFDIGTASFARTFFPLCLSVQSKPWQWVFYLDGESGNPAEHLGRKEFHDKRNAHGALLHHDVPEVEVPHHGTPKRRDLWPMANHERFFVAFERHVGQDLLPGVVSEPIEQRPGILAVLCKRREAMLIAMVLSRLGSVWVHLVADERFLGAALQSRFHGTYAVRRVGRVVGCGSHKVTPGEDLVAPFGRDWPVVVRRATLSSRLCVRLNNESDFKSHEILLCERFQAPLSYRKNTKSI